MWDIIWGLVSLIVFIGCPCLLLYWTRIVPRNKDEQHGGGFDGASPAWAGRLWVAIRPFDAGCILSRLLLTRRIQANSRT